MSSPSNKNGKALAEAAGAVKHPSCLRMLNQGMAQVPGEHKIRSARSAEELDSLCGQISRAERLLARAEYCAEKRGK